MFAYLDNSATTKVAPEAAEKMRQVMCEDFGNPSSLHRLGLNAEKILKASRRTVADALGAQPEEIVFTSCGTESDATAIFGTWQSRKKQGRRILTTQVEHPAVLRCFEQLEREGAEAVFLPVNKTGILSIKALEQALTPETVLVSVMHVNNETGAVMPLQEVRERVRRLAPNALLHTDAVQSFGKIDTNVKQLGVDLLSVSAHKIHGPKGVGALYVRAGVHIPPFLLGGGQEGGMRSGTENLPGIAGFAEAVRLASSDAAGKRARMAQLRDRLKEALLEAIPDAQVNGPLGAADPRPDQAAPQILNVSFPGCRSEVLLHMLEEKDVYVSTGSACSSHSKKGSHVLAAMGLSPQAVEGALRFSLSYETTAEEIDWAAQAAAEAVRAHRKLLGAFRRR